MAQAMSSQIPSGSDAPRLFVGRGEELARLSRAIRRPGGAIVVAGEAGVGKTSLIRQVVFDTDRRAAVFQGGALSTLRWVPFLALQQALRRSAPRDDALWSGDAEFVAAAVEEIVGGGLLVLDDVHWADSATWSVLHLLAGRVRIVAAVRLGDPAAADALRRLEDEGFDRLDVHPLPQADALVIARHTRPDLAEHAALDIVARAGGNPLVVEELAAGNVASLKLAIEGRLAGLPESAAADLEMLALAGRALPVESVVESAALLRAGTIVEEHGEVSVRHALLAEVIADGIDPDRLAPLHRRLADVIADPGTRARHLQMAGDTRRAYAEAMIAVEAARTPGERVAHLTTAASCASATQEPGLLIRAAQAAGYAGEFDTAWGLLDRITDPGLDAALVRAHLFGEIGDGDGWLAELGRARRILDERSSDSAGTSSGISAVDRITLLAEEARATLLAAGDPPRAIEQARVAVAEADRLGQCQGRAHYVLGTALYYVADQRSRAELELSCDHARREGDLIIEMRAANNLIVVHEGGGDPAVGRAVAEEMMAYAAELKLLRWQRHFAAAAMNIAVHAGDFEDVVARSPELLAGQMMRRTRDQLTSTYVLALMHLGRIDESLRIAEAQLADSEIFRSNLFFLQAIGAAYRGDDDGVLRAWEPFVAAAENAHRIGLAAPTFVRAARNVTLRDAPEVEYDGSRPLGADLLPGLPSLAELEEICEVPMIRAVPIELEALSVEPSDPGQAASLYASAAEVYRPYERDGELRCRWLQGGALAAAGQGADAVAVLTDAEERAAGHHMAALVALVQRSLREHGVRRPGSRSAGPLTGRQAEILDLVGRGLPDAEIAARLGLSVRTVHSHVAAARQALGAANRHQAALLAAELDRP